jgi:dolichyl-phosphate-mannose--protein O-mannosyl transferase
MAAPSEHQKDPLGWTALIAFAFLLLVLVRLTIPSKPFFDEVHYLPAARALLELDNPLNREHPLLGKEIIAAGIAIFGDRPFGWRIFPPLFGTLALFAFMRALWFATESRFATIAGGILLVTAVPLFIHSRIAMLDIFMVSFTMVALWMCAGAVREPEKARPRLAFAGISLGLAMAAKWNAIPIAVLPGLAFLAFSIHSARGNFLFATRGAPVPGIGLLEAALWLGLAPLLAYALTFVPAYFYAQRPLGDEGLIRYHMDMLSLQTQTLKSHPYQSVWTQWIGNTRAIWYLYENVDGAQRGVLLVGNPFTMLVGLIAMAWCALGGIAKRRWDALAVFVLFAASLGFWAIAAKSVQFYYHYFLPSCFLMAALALGLDEFWKRKSRVVPLAVVGISIALFAWFYPILSAAPLEGTHAFEKWMWYDGWR